MSITNSCIIKNCGRKSKSRGLCAMHRARVKRHNDVNYTGKGRAICTVNNCTKYVHGLGYCFNHYMSHKKYGDPLFAVGKREQHGMYTSPEYRIYMGMKARCYNKKNEEYRRYGGRGIKICDRWLNSFSKFYNDMGNRPSKEYSIDRVNVNGNYSLKNCRWATKSQQSINTRKRVNNTSGYRGVSPHCGKWVATIWFNSYQIYIGIFTSKQIAAYMYDCYSICLRHEDAITNFSYEAVGMVVSEAGSKIDSCVKSPVPSLKTWPLASGCACTVTSIVNSSELL